VRVGLAELSPYRFDEVAGVRAQVDGVGVEDSGHTGKAGAGLLADSRRRDPITAQELANCDTDSEPAADAHLVAPVLVTELPLKISLLPGDDSELHHDYDGNNQEQDPKRVENHPNPDIE
jgi:hypothetical protein